MQLLLMRHGDAKDALDDAVRPLSARGQQEAELAGKALAALEIRPKLAYHSTLLRSRQTAQITTTAYGGAELYECAGLLPGDNPLSFAAELSGDLADELLVVGHLPFMAELGSLLLCGDMLGAPIKFTTGSVLCLTSSSGSMLWALKFFLSSKTISKLVF